MAFKTKKEKTPRSKEISENINIGKYYAKIQRKYGYVPKRFLKKVK